MTTLAPASVRGESPRLILTSLLLDPGEYTLRVAAVDERGRAGSVHHSINARLTRMAGGLSVSDLMLVPQPPNGGELPRPRPSGIIDSETLTAMVEMSGNDANLLTPIEGDDRDRRRRERQRAGQRRGAPGHALEQPARLCRHAAARRAAAGRVHRPRHPQGAGPGRAAAGAAVPDGAGRWPTPPRCRSIRACRSIRMRRRRRWPR